MGIGSIPSII